MSLASLAPPQPSPSSVPTCDSIYCCYYDYAAIDYGCRRMPQLANLPQLAIGRHHWPKPRAVAISSCCRPSTHGRTRCHLGAVLGGAVAVPLRRRRAILLSILREARGLGPGHVQPEGLPRPRDSGPDRGYRGPGGGEACVQRAALARLSSSRPTGTARQQRQHTTPYPSHRLDLAS